MSADHGSLPTPQILQRLAAEPAAVVRVGAVLADDRWETAFFEITTPPPSVRQARQWSYPTARFVAQHLSGAALAKWLEGVGAGPLAWVEPPALDPNASFSRHPSRGLVYGARTIEWPSTRYSLWRRTGNLPGDWLVAEGAPSFSSYGHAAAAFLDLNDPRLNAGFLPESMYIVMDRAGRIDRVRVHATEILVDLEGEGLQGCTLELVTAGRDHPTAAVTSLTLRQTVAVPTPQGIPPETLLVLTNGHRWVDTRLLNSAYGARPDSDIEYVTEPFAGLDALRLRGEGPAIEFKSHAPDNPGARDKVCRTLAAFANGDGGQLLFGVTDDGEVIGVPEDVASSPGRDTITRWIRDRTAPLLPFAVDTVAAESGAKVVVVTVDQGSHPPYGVNPTAPVFYLRRGATTFPATADEVRALALSRASSPPD